MPASSSPLDKSIDLITQIHERLDMLRGLKESISEDYETNLLVRRINELEIDFNLTSDLLRERDWDSDLSISQPCFCY